jgi:hypothetical protein
MSFDIETYLNSLPDDTKHIDLSKRGLTYLPDLSRFKELVILDCSFNKLTSLPHLNEKLDCLICSFNQLTSLPPLNEKLEILDCNNNQLTSLPLLNEKLKMLYCYNNQLTSLPHLNEKLQYLEFKFNPIYNLILSCYDYFPTDNMLINKTLKKINNFRDLYYSLKFKKHFIKWLWKSKEKKIMEKYHPKYLWENLEEKTDLDEFLEKW